MQVHILSLLMLLVTGSYAGAQDAVYLIRHCEKELSGDDPALTAEGRKRAADWAEKRTAMATEPRVNVFICFFSLDDTFGENQKQSVFPDRRRGR